MKKHFCFIVPVGLIILMGCSGIEPPMPDKLLKHPLGTTPLHLGMAKDEAREIFGEPDVIQDKGKSNDAGSTEREEWIYYGKMKNLPISYANLSKSLHIYFDGNSITGFREE